MDCLGAEHGDEAGCGARGVEAAGEQHEQGAEHDGGGAGQVELLGAEEGEGGDSCGGAEGVASDDGPRLREGRLGDGGDESGGGAEAAEEHEPGGGEVERREELGVDEVVGDGDGGDAQAAADAGAQRFGPRDTGGRGRAQAIPAKTLAEILGERTHKI